MLRDRGHKLWVAITQQIIGVSTLWVKAITFTMQVTSYIASSSSAPVLHVFLGPLVKVIVFTFYMHITVQRSIFAQHKQFRKFLIPPHNACFNHNNI